MGKPRQPIKHGTISGYREHYRREELPVCTDCKGAQSVYNIRHGQIRRSRQRRALGMTR